MSHCPSDTHRPRTLSHDLLVLASTYEDIEKLVTATKLRYAELIAPPRQGEKGGTYGKGMPSELPTVEAVKGFLDKLEKVKNQVSRQLEKGMKDHPLTPWVMEQKGFGLPSLALLLGHIGDPTWNDRDSTERTIGSLFRYVGVAGPHQRMRKTDENGREVKFNRKAKTRLWIIANNMISHGIRTDRKTGVRHATTRWGEIYVNELKNAEGRTHTDECRNTMMAPMSNGCGTREHPEWGAIGSPWRPGHINGNARRILMREVMRGLQIETCRTKEVSMPTDRPSGGLRSAPIGHVRSDTQRASADGGDSPGTGQGTSDTQGAFAGAGDPPEAA